MRGAPRATQRWRSCGADSYSEFTIGACGIRAQANRISKSAPVQGRARNGEPVTPEEQIRERVLVFLRTACKFIEQGAYETGRQSLEDAHHELGRLIRD